MTLIIYKNFWKLWKIFVQSQISLTFCEQCMFHGWKSNQSIFLSAKSCFLHIKPWWKPVVISLAAWELKDSHTLMKGSEAMDVSPTTNGRSCSLSTCNRRDTLLFVNDLVLQISTPLSNPLKIFYNSSFIFLSLPMISIYDINKKTALPLYSIFDLHSDIKSRECICSLTIF